MFGDITGLTRTVVPSAPDDSPTFPLYLLPSFPISFRRQCRTTAPPPLGGAAAAAAAAAPESPVPSLSSSPGSLPSSSTKFYLSGSGTARLARAQHDTLRCGGCATDVAFTSQIVSKGFTGRHGRAFLVAPPSLRPTPSCPASAVNDNITPGSTEADLVNTRVGRPENRQLVTGMHVVADIWCVVCGAKLGWKYVDAREPTQKYKVGKFILETQRVVAHRGWADIEPVPDVLGPEAEESYNISRSTRPRSARSSTDTDTTASYTSEESDSRDYNEDDDTDVDDDDGVVVFDSEDEDECEDMFAGVWDAEVVAKRRQTKIAYLRRHGHAA